MNATIIKKIFQLDSRNSRLGALGEYLVKEYFQKAGYKVKKSSDNAVDLLLCKENKIRFAIEVKAHKGTQGPLKESPVSFNCLHISDRVLEKMHFFQEKYRIPVLLVWLQTTTGKIFEAKLDSLAQDCEFFGAKFPHPAEFTGESEPKTTFAEQQFKYVGSISQADFELIQEKFYTEKQAALADEKSSSSIHLTGEILRAHEWDASDIVFR